jgi:phage shock protein A
MSKIMKMRDSRDKIIDQLIDDKNRIYTRLKREERENQVFRSQVKYLKQRLEYAEKKIKELSNEIINSRAKEEGSGEGDSVRQ